ncbi:cobalamin-5'-phosphate synthase [Lachnospiraceae bacterium KH1T2]|nr:cobalamin-5'-phosphate synthase [Lachnospiraceae bacterium KH1T2]
MNILKSFCIAFAMYSRIPVPIFDWTEENMKYAISFFPFVGAVIMGISALWYHFAAGRAEGIVIALVGIAISCVISGGIHLDGYMDTSDALSSHMERERKLEILKDPHIGAFSVISIITYFLFFAGAYTAAAKSKTDMLFIFSGFIVSRIYSGLAVVLFKSAKKDGLLYTFADNSHKTAVRASLAAELIIYTAVMSLVSAAEAITVVAINGAFWVYYYKKTKREFGGITGDTCGWFSSLSELLTAVVAAVFCMMR